MDWSIAKILMQDGLVTGVIYALMAVSLVLVFVVTRIIFIAQGEFVTFGALTFAIMADGGKPGTIWLLPMFGAVLFLKELYFVYKGKDRKTLLKSLGVFVIYPLFLLWAVPVVLATDPSLWVKAFLTLLLVVPLGPMLYRLAYEPVAEHSVLTLLIVSIAVHYALVGLGLVFFGAEGWLVSEPFFDGTVEIASLNWSYQSLFVIGMTVVIIGALWLFFGKTLYGRALRATAVNRRGARLVGIGTSMSGHLTFFLTALVGVLSGIMIVSFITITYETGFMIGLKGFVGAIIGGLVSYPLAAFGAIAIGIIEAFTTFWASDYKEVIVFGLVIPVLLLRAILVKHEEDEE